MIEPPTGLFNGLPALPPVPQEKLFIYYFMMNVCLVCPGLSKLPSDDAQHLAFDLAQRWIRTNWMAYTKHDAMFEKVSVVKVFPGCCSVVTQPAQDPLLLLLLLPPDSTM